MSEPLLNPFIPISRRLTGSLLTIPHFPLAQYFHHVQFYLTISRIAMSTGRHVRVCYFLLGKASVFYDLR